MLKEHIFEQIREHRHCGQLAANYVASLRYLHDRLGKVDGLALGLLFVGD